jgi:hypothetical protein
MFENVTLEQLGLEKTLHRIFSETKTSGYLVASDSCYVVLINHSRVGEPWQQEKLKGLFRGGLQEMEGVPEEKYRTLASALDKPIPKVHGVPNNAYTGVNEKVLTEEGVEFIARYVWKTAHVGEFLRNHSVPFHSIVYAAPNPPSPNKPS